MVLPLLILYRCNMTHEDLLVKKKELLIDKFEFIESFHSIFDEFVQHARLLYLSLGEGARNEMEQSNGVE